MQTRIGEILMTKYYSRSKQKFVDIANMPDQYVRNAFVKMCKHEPTEDAIFGEQQRERADLRSTTRNLQRITLHLV